MNSLRSRLIISHLLPLLVVIPLVAIALIYILETQVLLSELSQNVNARAEVIAATVSERPEILTDVDAAYAFVSQTARITKGRVVLYRPSGDLWADSEGETAPLLSGGGQGVVVRYSLWQQGAEAYAPVRDINQELIGMVGVSQVLEGTASAFARLRWWILGILLIELVIGVTLGYSLAVRLARPIDRAAAAVVDVANGQQIEPLIPSGPLEIRSLAAAVNELAHRLRALEEIRRRSLANIVHELARPLAAIIAAAHVLRGEAGADAEVREELLAGIEGEVQRMQPLLDDLAQLHGQIQGTIRLQRQPTDLNTWLPAVLLPWRAAAIENELQWQIDLSPNLPTLLLDPDRIGQALGNLLSNAIKYTPAGGSVRVTAEVDAGEVRMAVHDSGMGISTAEQQTIFEPFYRSQRQRRFPQGLGLGLTLAQELVVAHHGHITLTSSEGEGSTFVIHLPLER